MKRIILMRHSHAVGSASSDRQRALTSEGEALAAQTGKLLNNWAIDQIICSSATRTRQTAEIVSEELSISKITTSDQLYLAGPEVYSSVVVDVASDDAACILMIGHNPGVASLMAQWAGQPIPVPPATACVFQLGIDAWVDLLSITRVDRTLETYICNGHHQAE